MSNLLVKELRGSRYRLLGLVGQGQFGRVYCASHRKTGHLVALKELDKERFPTHKFLRELRFLLSLQHPNIVNCYAMEHTHTRRYLVMDYCEGGTLRSLMEEDIRLHPAQSLKLIADVLAGLDHAHSRGIIHCDIKPENILLTVHADGWMARISDFGIARLHQDSVREGTGDTGSPAYMAPERFYGQYSQSSDLYAVGILLFELLSGYRPFSGQPAELMAAHLNQPVKMPEAIAAVLQPIILTALQKLPARRFRSASEMLLEVQTATQTLKAELEEAWESHELLYSAVDLPKTSFSCLRQEILQAEIRQLVAGADLTPAWVPENAADLPGEQPSAAQMQQPPDSERVYQIFGSYVGCQRYPDGILQSELQGGAALTTVRLPEPVQQLIVRPQGCFTVLPRSVYRVPPLALLQSNIAQHGQKRLQQGGGAQGALIHHRVPQLVAEFSQNVMAAIAPDGRWMATATVDPSKISTSLNFWHLGRRQRIRALTCHPIHLVQLVALDLRHVAVFSHTVESQKACITGMRIEVFTRRGNAIGVLNLSVPLRSLSFSHTPYRLLGLEPGYSKTVLLIDLKPLRILRVSVEIVPVLVTATPWGYILIDADGQIVLLDQYGQKVGRIDGPANPTAIASPNPYGLLISTGKNHQGTLYTLDLRHLDLDFVF